jgi:hypothetical protein
LYARCCESRDKILKESKESKEYEEFKEAASSERALLTPGFRLLAPLLELLVLLGLLGLL